MTGYNLYSLSRKEAELLARAADYLVSLRNLQSVLTDAELDILFDLRSVLRNKGFPAYVGSVTDQDGDSSWQLTSSLSQIRAWANDYAFVSFETPRTYKIKITRIGFGIAIALTTRPNAKRSQLYFD